MTPEEKTRAGRHNLGPGRLNPSILARVGVLLDADPESPPEKVGAAVGLTARGVEPYVEAVLRSLSATAFRREYLADPTPTGSVSVVYSDGWTVRIDGKARFTYDGYRDAEADARRIASARGAKVTLPDPTEVARIEERIDAARRGLRP